MLLAGGQEFLDGAFQLPPPVRGAPPDLSLREQAEAALHQVQPAGMRRGEVQVIPGSARKPSAGGRSLVGRIVVQHDVHLGRRGKPGIQMVEKFLKFVRAMTSKTCSLYIAGGYIQGRKQGGPGVPLVIVAVTLRRGDSWEKF